MHVGGQFAAELFQERVHHLRVDLRCDQPRGLTGLGTGRRKHVQIVVLILLNGLGTRADLGPDARDRAVLPEAGLILVVDQEAFVGVVRGDLRQRLGELFFLKDSSTAGSVSGWVVRGIRSL